jgi:hypothetical protein
MGGRFGAAFQVPTPAEIGALQNLSGSKATQKLLTGFETTLVKFFLTEK